MSVPGPALALYTHGLCFQLGVIHILRTQKNHIFLLPILWTPPPCVCTKLLYPSPR